jgi:CRP/FNR family transcriptional regulator
LTAFYRSNLPFWEYLAESDQESIVDNTKILFFRAGAIIHNGADKECPGVYVVKKGRTRVYISSPDGRELTIHHVLDNEIHAFGFDCVLDRIIYSVSMETETDCEIVLISKYVLQRLYDTNAAVKNSVTQSLAVRLHLILNLLETIAFSSVGNRLANLLIAQRKLADSPVIKITHTKIAAEIGTVREVVTRLLAHLQTEGVVALSRGSITINDLQKLTKIGQDRFGVVIK